MSCRPIVMALCAVMLSSPLATAHETRVTTDGTVRALPSNGGKLVNILHAGQRVEVVSCDRGVVWCFLQLPGQDGWARAQLLQFPIQPTLPCPPACGPKQ